MPSHASADERIAELEAERDEARAIVERFGDNYNGVRSWMTLYGRQAEKVERLRGALQELLESSEWFSRQRCAEACQSYGGGTDAEQRARAALAPAEPGEGE